MLRFRPKLGSERSNEWKCCCCLHVRTGTILLGTWHLMLHLIALGFLAAIVRDPQLIEELEKDSAPDWSDIGSALPTPLSNVERPASSFSLASPQRDHTLVYHDVDTGALVTVCTLAITLMLIYGASRGKPSHLLPFFCMQIFDFAITVLTATGYVCYLRSIHRLVAESRHVPWRAELLRLPAPALAALLLAAFLLATLFKAYCISVVWRCYKYLTMREHAIQCLTPFVTELRTNVAATPAPSPAPAYATLLPAYEEAVKLSPPPSYRAATRMAANEPSVVVSGEQPPPPPAATVVVVPQSGAPATV